MQRGAFTAGAAALPCVPSWQILSISLKEKQRPANAMHNPILDLCGISVSQYSRNCSHNVGAILDKVADNRELPDTLVHSHLRDWLFPL